MFLFKGLADVFVHPGLEGRLAVAAGGVGGQGDDGDVGHMAEVLGISDEVPFIYGIGTGLPVLIFAVGISFGVHSMAHWFNKVAKLEIYMRKATAVIFILVGIYYIWAYIVSTLRI